MYAHFSHTAYKNTHWECEATYLGMYTFPYLPYLTCTSHLLHRTELTSPSYLGISTTKLTLCLPSTH